MITCIVSILIQHTVYVLLYINLADLFTLVMIRSAQTSNLKTVINM